MTISPPSVAMRFATVRDIAWDETKHNSIVAFFYSDTIEKIRANSSVEVHCLPLKRGIDPHERGPSVSSIVTGGTTKLYHRYGHNPEKAAVTASPTRRFVMAA